MAEELPEVGRFELKQYRARIKSFRAVEKETALKIDENSSSSSILYENL